MVGIMVLNQPEKQTYSVGEKLDTTGMVVAAIYDNGDIEPIEGYEVGELKDTVGKQTINVSYNGFVTAFNVTVEDKKLRVGDVDGDGNITIMDATMIQIHLAQVSQIPDNRFNCADTDKDGNITIIDATTIQLFIAHIIPSL